MLRKTIQKVKRALGEVRFGLLILQWCGPRIFISKLLHQLYGQTVFLVTTGNLDDPHPSSDFVCTVSLATPDDIKELFGGLHTEDREGRYGLLVRQWYHESGYGDCYVARAADTNEICVVRWLVTPEHIKKMGWEARYPLADDEIMLENVYSFERYRRKGARIASSDLAQKIALQLGYKRTKGYSEVTNIPQLSWNEKAGAKACAKIVERHFFFRVTRKTLETYNPPVLIKAPVGNK